jgi:hypothetical protein
MNEPAIRTSRSIGWIRFIVWLMPVCIIPFVLFASRALWIPFSRELGYIAAIAALFYLARFDALLKCQQLQIPPDDPRAKIGKRMAIFIGVQLLIPVVIGSVLFAIWALQGFPMGGC